MTHIDECMLDIKKYIAEFDAVLFQVQQLHDVLQLVQGAAGRPTKMMRTCNALLLWQIYTHLVQLPGLLPHYMLYCLTVCVSHRHDVQLAGPDGHLSMDEAIIWLHEQPELAGPLKRLAGDGLSVSAVLFATPVQDSSKLL